MQQPFDAIPHGGPAGTQRHEPLRPSAKAPRQRPLWMLAALAIGFAPFLARTLFDEHLAVLSTYLVNALDIAVQDRSDIHLTRIAVRFCLPVCVALALLRFTSLGRWLALTPLSLALLLVADTVLLLNIVDQLRLFVLSGYPRFQFTGNVAAVVAGTTLSLAAASLALATAWYRYDTARQWLTKAGRRWLGEA